MVNTHEMNLGVSDFETLRNNDYIIVQIGGIEVGDYILFKQVEGSESTETGATSMTRVTDILKNDGLKEGYALLIVTKLG